MSYDKKLNELNFRDKEEKKKFVREMFNSIYRTYDLLNHLLSFGIDIYWRKRALKDIYLHEDDTCLDLAAGTGDFGIEVHKKFQCNIIGYDIAENSLKVFQEKVKKKKFDESKFTFIVGEAENINLQDETVNLITIAFGIRNFYDSQKSLNEMYRVLKNGGRILILEFSLPENRFIRFIYRLYFEKILPFIGKIISKDNSAYKYLPASVKLFEQEKDIAGEIIKAGFRELKIEPLTFGIVKLYSARKSPEY
ncbi:MAG: demethylmenaquinone methyltransferase [Ignavibacterium sp.]|jgi:demethylmenaquinone methyltransferase/2-methoxy-6-polyprenyl-1,4-benzoquinol methylase|nr:bifunctional demethylmenaquinone methyltransferase/2-methoxy-6-polyprenyl-1,4-benzoquinol methylase UbiE [Ignavibacteria bacterium]MDH7527320.1 bifunctional demethylmenaquinone methyltransferase/2-methoxy-6-polyprenyl-1,4-benzoquinol methylase UbiE [Ignavibacteria bacterium]GIV45347.1 MAG: demethylmenaquinone methyltransferase [Ignavibacterium sp.]